METIQKAEGAMKKRWDYIDMLKGIGIFFVVLGHTNRIDDTFLKWIYSFHMVLFFWVAGYLIGKQTRNGDKIEIQWKKQAKIALVPYLWFSIFAVLWDAIGIFLEPQQYTTALLWEKIWNSLSFYGVSVLWFLPAYFLAVSLYRLLRRRFGYAICLLISLLLSASYFAIRFVPEYIAGQDMSLKIFCLQMAFSLWRGIFCIVFVAVGEGVSVLLEKLYKKKLLSVLLAVAMLGLGSLAGICNEMASLRYLQLGNVLLFAASGVGITTGLLMLCNWYGECAPIEFIGRNSLIILVTHLDFRVMNIATKCSDKVFAMLDNNFARNLTMAVVLVVLELLIIWIFNRYFYFLIGKNKPILLKKTKKEEAE